MSQTKSRLLALSDVTLAIARAAAAGNADFAERLGTNVRQALAQRTARPGAFDETIVWLGRFEADAEAPAETADDADPGPVATED